MGRILGQLFLVVLLQITMAGFRHLGDPCFTAVPDMALLQIHGERVITLRRLLPEAPQLHSFELHAMELKMHQLAQAGTGLHVCSGPFCCQRCQQEIEETARNTASSSRDVCSSLFRKEQLLCLLSSPTSQRASEARILITGCR